MEPIQWTESFSVGVHAMDQQHIRIIRVINQLIAHPTGSGEPGALALQLHELTQFVEQHFLEEESLLAAQGYPGLAGQHAEHYAFKKNLAALCLEATQAPNGIPLRLLAFLKDWWVDHILVKDMAYRAHLLERGVR